MPLDHANGEDIDGIGVGNPVSIEKWASTPFFSMACESAESAFLKAGALAPIEFSGEEILVMEYPRQDRLAIVFAKHIAGIEHFHPFVMRFEPMTIAELKSSGLWNQTH